MTGEPVTTISVMAIADLDAVDELMKRNVGTLGFLPRAALEDYLTREGVLGAKTQDGRLVGYLMYAANRDRFRIAQLCVSEEGRGKGVARNLLEALKVSASTQKVITLRCRNDFPAHRMWPKLNQYQGGMCNSEVLKTTERTPHHLISPIGPNWVATDNAAWRYVHFTLALV